MRHIIHMVLVTLQPQNGFFSIHYLCNQACNTKLSKSSLSWDKVNCINCLKQYKRTKGDISEND